MNWASAAGVVPATTDASATTQAFTIAASPEPRLDIATKAKRSTLTFL
jgi:hypothetical protein